MRKDPVTIPTADFPEAQFLREALKVVVVQVGDVSALDWSKEKVGLHTADVTGQVRQNTPHQKIAVARRHACLAGPEDQ
ncbi:MAG: hypothetical protein ACRDTA_12650 [Pseudonocardiaceae bacterium]